MNPSSKWKGKASDLEEKFKMIKHKKKQENLWYHKNKKLRKLALCIACDDAASSRESCLAGGTVAATASPEQAWRGCRQWCRAAGVELMMRSGGCSPELKMPELLPAGTGLTGTCMDPRQRLQHQAECQARHSFPSHLTAMLAAS